MISAMYRQSKGSHFAYLASYGELFDNKLMHVGCKVSCVVSGKINYAIITSYINMIIIKYG